MPSSKPKLASSVMLTLIKSILRQNLSIDDNGIARFACEYIAISWVKGNPQLWRNWQQQSSLVI